MNSLVLIALGAAALFLPCRAQAQTPPTPAEIAAYRGLHAATARGDATELSRLIQSGADLNARDGNGRTPLHVAAFAGDQPIAQALLAAGADPNLLDGQRYDAVTIAAVRDDPAMVRTLLDSGASAKLVTSPYDGTALIAAAHLGHEGVVKELLRAGAPLDHVNNLGWTALLEAVILGDGGHPGAGWLAITSSHFGFLGCGGVGWLGWGRLRRCSAGRARWRPSEGQGFQELGPGGEHNIGAQGLQVVEEAGPGSKRLAGVPPSA